MEEKGNVIWIVIVSIVMFFVSFFVSLSGPYYISIGLVSSRRPSTSDLIWYYINRVDVLLFIVTITTATLSTTSFGKKELTYKLTLYFFLISMGLFFLSFMRLLFTLPST